MPYDQLGKLLLVAGGLIAVVGLLFLVFGRGFSGRLPGDLTYSSGNFTCIAPIATMIVVSIVLTILINVALRLFNR